MTKTATIHPPPRRESGFAPTDLLQELAGRVVGQFDAIQQIVPYVRMFQAGLAPEGRPVGVFLLLGPTGTGKTRTVEALADVLHGSEKCLVKINCGEFQMDHEVAKLIGAPPGYLGHRETHPMLSQQKLNEATSERSKLSLILFDEIEKAAPSFTRLLLGVLDKAVLKLGDNTAVNFEKSMIFMTSNLGAKTILDEMAPRFGFGKAAGQGGDVSQKKLERIAASALRRYFSPEFMNRLDVTLTYQTLTPRALERILDQQIRILQQTIFSRLGARAFRIEVPAPVRAFLLARGTSREFGARELKRTLHRMVIQPLGAMVADDGIPPCSELHIMRQGREHLRFEIRPAQARAYARASRAGSRGFPMPDEKTA